MVGAVSKYQKYAEYKDSGVAWLGEIPSSWDLVPIKYIATLNPKKSGLGLQTKLGKCSFIPMDKLKLNSIVLDEMRNIGEVFEGYTYFENNDVLMAKVTPCFENKNIAIAKELVNGIGFGSSEIYVLRSNHLSNNRFLYYRLQETTFMDIATAAMTGAGGLKRVPADIINSYSIAKPDIQEQIQIAAFLDHETAKIDSLIEKQQSLIALLKEKRQAVISHAVTKGLNPDAPMKDSGVEWLGEVTEHWEVSSIGYYAKVTNGTTPNKANLSYWDKQEIPWLSSGEVNQYYIVEAPECITKKALEECSLKLLPIGTVVMGMIGQGKTRGLSAITRLEATINQNLAALEPYPKLNNEYLHYYLQAVYDYIREEGRGGNQAALNCEIIRKFPITIPPFEEQVEIVEKIKNLSITYKALISKAESAIALMQERRTALISAAVTGKIDVRDWQAPAQTEPNLECSA